MQSLYEFTEGIWHRLDLPSQEDPLTHLPHLRWDSASRLFTPAFWRHQHWAHIELKPVAHNRYRLGNNLLEETMGCLLGGYGLKAESSMAYFALMKHLGTFERCPSDVNELFEILRTPVVINQKPRRYRFWKTKGLAMYDILKNHFDRIIEIEKNFKCPYALRDEMCRLPGIGMKTASWIARNWLDSDSIAVIDVHILRALSVLGFQCPKTMTRDSYLSAEFEFIGLARSLQIPSQTLDLVMWSRMRDMSSLIIKN